MINRDFGFRVANAIVNSRYMRRKKTPAESAPAS
jgi:hypothetical protein